MSTSRSMAAKPQSGDELLIRECVAFAQNVAADKAAYAADWLEDEYSAKICDALYQRSKVAFANISKISATTPAGLVAKARVVPTVIRYKSGGEVAMGQEEAEFFLLFSADVMTLLDPKRCLALDPPEISALINAALQNKLKRAS